MVIEQVEPRILHSADLVPHALADLASVPQAEVRVLETETVAGLAERGEAMHAASRELVVIDSATPDYQPLVDDILAQTDPDREIHILLIEAGDDGIQRITDALAGSSDIDAIHLISHGRDGAVRLGSSVLDFDTLLQRGTSISAWSDALSEHADLLIYGCEVAATAQGRSLIDALALMTGADVAASDDITGATGRGGDWILEYSAGSIEATPALSSALQQIWQGTLPDNVLVSYEVPFNELDDRSHEVKSGQAWGQRFRYDSPGPTYSVDKIDLVLYRDSDAPARNITVSLRSSMGGSVISSGTFSSETLGTAEAWVTVNLSSAATLNDNQNYVIRVSSSPGGGKVYVGVDSSGTFADGVLLEDDGDTVSGKDMAFRVIDSVSNTAPVLAGANNLTSITEDPAANAGTLVSGLIAGQVTDADGGAVAGIAVTAVTNSNGTWQYSTNGGAAWNSFGTPTTTSARLLSAEANTLVRFVPDANWNGTIANGLTFRAWDQTNGTAGGTADTTVNGGTTAFSVATAASSITVTAVNDAPVGTSNTVVTNEDTPLVLSAAVFGFTDPNDTPANSLQAVRITTLPSAGTLTLSGAAVSAGQSISVTDLNAGNLVFMPSANANGVGYASFTFQVQDDGGAPNLDPIARTLAVDVTAVNDPPVGTSTTVVTNEDTPLVFSAAVFGFTDPNDTPANSLQALRITTLPSAGALTLSGAAVSTGQFISVTDLNAGNLVFTPTANANGVGYASFTFQVQDNGGGVDLDPIARTLTVDVTAVNDAPVGTSNIVVTTEDTPLVLSAATFGFTDPDDAPANSLQAVRITTLPSAGALTLSGAAVSTGQFINVTDLNAGNLVFTPSANTNGAGYASFTFQVQDNGGGANLALIARTLTVDVAAVNDAPVNTVPGAQSTTINTPVIFSVGTGNPILVDDLDAGGSAVEVTLAATNGTLTLSGTTGLTFSVGSGAGDASMTFVGILSDVNSALAGLRYDPAFNFFGVDQVDVTTNDTGNTGSGGPRSTTNAVPLNVAFVNTAPMLSGATDLSGINEDVAADPGTLVSTLITGEINDPDPAALRGIAVTGLDNTDGTWQYSTDSGSNWTAFGAASATSARLLAADANTFVRFVPAANWNGTVANGLTFRAWDQTSGTAGGTADTAVNGGTTAFSVATAASSITVAAVNDAPMGTSNTVATNEDTPLVLSAAVFGFTDPDDTPANSLQAVRITTLPSAGALTLSGAAVSTGQFISVTDLNAGNLIFTPTANANGAGYASFTFQVEDDGGGVDLDPSARTLTVDVNAVNDRPVGMNDTVVTNEDTPLVLSAVVFGFTDPDDTPANSLQAVRITTLPSAGALTLSGAAVSAGQFISVTDLNAGNLVFTPTANANGAGYASFTFQVQDNGGGANSDPSARTLTVDVNAVNDPPTVVTQGLTVSAGSTSQIGNAELQATDIDTAATRLVFDVSAAPSNGRLELNIAPGVAVTAFSQADIDANRVMYVHDGSRSLVDRFSFTVNDGAGGTVGTLTFVINVNAEPPVNDDPEIQGFDQATSLSSPAAFGAETAIVGTATGGNAVQAKPATATAPVATQPQARTVAEDPAAGPVLEPSGTGLVRLSVPSEASSRTQRDAGTPLSDVNALMFALNDAADTQFVFMPAELRQSSAAHAQTADTPAMMEGLDEMRERLREDTRGEAAVIGATTGAATGLSVGYVLWLLRGGVLLSSLLSSLPAWRLVDPLPILGRLDDDEEIDEADDDSLESLLAQNNLATHSKNMLTPAPEVLN